ncbi:hypothetical protein FACS18947_6440 [Bacteroidia bacterium]|nr:hypothetical protein FACS18947_6440 [Bacteroidia bacterium]
MFYRYPVNDVHIHAFTLEGAENTLAMVEELGYERFNMLSGASCRDEWTANNILCAYIKAKSSGKGYAFAAVNYPQTGIPSAQNMLLQVKNYRRWGFDGIKMMDGKPTMRRRTAVPLNDPAYDPMFSYMEQTGFPVLYHVNDPWEFWHWDKMPEWAKQHGKMLCYGEGGYPSFEQIRDEAIGIVEKHPNLKIIFAHFFFTATDIELTRSYFEKFPNLYYDITPGWEMFESFAENYDAWRQFFIDYSERILFGTDTWSGHWRDTVGCLRRVMETDDEFIAFEEHCKGLKLDGLPLENIYHNNFYRYLPKEPAALDIEAVLSYGKTLYSWIDGMRDVDKEAIKKDVTDFSRALSGLMRTAE